MGITVTPKAASEYFRTVLTADTNEDEYDQFIYPLEVGAVFFYDPKSIDYETIRHRVTNLYLPDTLQTFDVAYVQPGTILYSINGPCCIAVIAKTAK